MKYFFALVLSFLLTSCKPVSQSNIQHMYLFQGQLPLNCQNLVLHNCGVNLIDCVAADGSNYSVYCATNLIDVEVKPK